MKFAWCTDLHLDHVDGLKATGFSLTSPVSAFLNSITQKQPEAIVITGDISNARRIKHHLERIAEIAPVYYVFGNHDFYEGSVRRLRKWAKIRKPSYLWLQSAGVVHLGGNVGLVGVDGWGDARLGNVQNSPVGLNDWTLIEELIYEPSKYPGSWTPNVMSDRARRRREKTLQKLGSDDARALKKALTAALGRFQKVLVATHVPPWPEAAWYARKPSGPDWLPWFCCQATGEVISECARANPDKEIVVLCGHTHGGGEAQILPNVYAYTGPATYGAPAVQKMFEV